MQKPNPINWITNNLDVKPASYGEFFYGQIEKWAKGGIPGIQCDLNPQERSHVIQRASELDFVSSVGRGRILDFGPGDGWPSLRIAPLVESVTGVEGSRQRVDVCRENAQQKGIKNAEFVFVDPGTPLPFDDSEFDGVVASWSLEETPDLEFTVQELYRVLKPGGKMQFQRVPMSFFSQSETPGMYVGDTLQGNTIVLIGKPDPKDQTVEFHGLQLNMKKVDFENVFQKFQVPVEFDSLNAEILSILQPDIENAGAWVTRNPGCREWIELLLRVGFTQAEAIVDSGDEAGRLFDTLPKDQMPKDERELDELLLPFVMKAIQKKAPLDSDAPIFALK